jgi:hypothetical protein
LHFIAVFNGIKGDEDWEVLFTTDRIRTDGINFFLPLRTTVTFDAIKNSYKVQQTILKEWPAFKAGETDWLNADKGNKTTFRFDELPFFYMDAQRDIVFEHWGANVLRVLQLPEQERIPFFLFRHCLPVNR